MKSYKVHKPSVEAPSKPKHSTTLADLKDRKHITKKLHKKKGAGLSGVIATLKKMNASMSKSAKKMPGDKDVADWLWK